MKQKSIKLDILLISRELGLVENKPRTKKKVK